MRIGVPQVVDAVGLSRRVLERKCRQHLGRTPREEVMRVRIVHAKMLLSQTDMLIERIAQKCGFRDSRNFARDFMREVKSTPRQYRKNLHLGPAETEEIEWKTSYS